MAINTIITRGFGNGTYNGTIALVVPRGFIAGAVVATTTIDIEGTVEVERTPSGTVEVLRSPSGTVEILRTPSGTVEIE